ncbi:hypothetical protein MATL_G00000800 [Megalops atlanticus]|uniref:C-type lectin domain-containing protein n=1 Tax=Megalops atlanticus TaxID=7932 RepID=A0A9D3QFL8_MEGAT|nr:hypothetical protein MATL_G00000800 [Megalops atlanticus]
METMRLLTIAVLLCTALALPAATGETEETEGVDDVASSPVIVNSAKEKNNLELHQDSVNSPRKKKYVECVNCHHWGHCTAGWTRFGPYCFLFVHNSKPWTNAEAHCNFLGGHLASVHNYQEFHFIRSLSHRTAWIGGTDSYTEGNWRWTDGSGFYYTQWNSGEPNNAYGSEHCLCINYEGTHGWNDYFCTQSYPFICAKTI